MENEEFEIVVGNHFEGLGYLHTDQLDPVGCKQVQRGSFEEIVSEGVEAVVGNHSEKFGEFRVVELLDPAGHKTKVQEKSEAIVSADLEDL